MTIKLPSEVKLILNHFKESGYEAFCVGGAVRDSLMGNEPGDWDITTNATPDETAKIFKNYKII